MDLHCICDHIIRNCVEGVSTFVLSYILRISVWNWHDLKYVLRHSG